LRLYSDLDASIATPGAQSTGASVQSAEDSKLRAGMDKITRDVFGNSARVKQGQASKFHDAAFRILENAG
jgi:hypothetical protein